jgi:hypothetical protein
MLQFVDWLLPLWQYDPSADGHRRYPLNYQIDYVSKIVAASGGGIITGNRL